MGFATAGPVGAAVAPIDATTAETATATITRNGNPMPRPLRGIEDRVPLSALALRAPSA